MNNNRPVAKNTSQEIKGPVIVLIGPTAIGKTDLSLSLAERYGCEIISVDSMQVYRYMDIGTAKPSISEQRGIKHYLIDIADPDEQYDASAFRRDALAAVREIITRQKIPLLTGGTGLYLKALLEGMFEIEGTRSKDIRGELLERLATEGRKKLYDDLLEIDPKAAEKIHINDTQRLVRALEIYFSTGKPWSVHLENQAAAPVLFPKMFQAGLTCEREVLYERINRRADIMLQNGLIEEVRGLLDMGYREELSSMQSIGYRHACNYIAGRWDMDELKELLKRDTRRYAKRQMAWFAKNPSLVWFERNEHDRLYTTLDNWLAETVGR